ncbi:hypothetical protein IQ241_00050 [Romeria aff. gracilis LEGE 07310]|uniref:Secreted RxLR effector peptide protein n=1 Tax=Vasconcelosia minhoensis LEGE 07310 TaxID=915328 RepID=A0A8J7A9K9_9CYAN|nr:hypothetical protein [Romeria gracilis]MBE9075704.1 hypothetical protein [Romeria aff. gracilis LEGE 07310]
MKRYFFTAVALTIAAAGTIPAANAAEFESDSLQQRRYEVLDRGGSKSIAILENSTKDQQVSSADEISEDATFIDLIRHNRDSRGSK